MPQRREFSRKIRAQIVLRATNAKGQVVCEGCGLVLGKKPYEIDHTIPEAMQGDDAPALTAKGGKLLGRDCCHKGKTASDISTIRKSDRVRDKHSGAFKRPSRFPNSRDGKWKAKLDGTTVRRNP